MTARAEVIPILRHRDEKIVSLEEKRPFDCVWCGMSVERYHATEDFKGTPLHRTCSLEARLSDLVSVVEEQRKQIKELFHLTGV